MCQIWNAQYQYLALQYQDAQAAHVQFEAMIGHATEDMVRFMIRIVLSYISSYAVPFRVRRLGNCMQLSPGLREHC